MPLPFISTSSPAAAAFSKAPHFAKSVPVLVRFSDPTGVPTLPDADPNASPHGMAIRFTLPDGGITDIVSLSANSFPVATPEDFLAFLQAAAASGPTAAKPTPIEKFLGAHPAAVAQAPYVEPTVAAQGVIVPGEQLAGVIAPYQNVAISSTLTEPADAGNVAEGDVVHRGEVLA